MALMALIALMLAKLEGIEGVYYEDTETLMALYLHSPMRTTSISSINLTPQVT